MKWFIYLAHIGFLFLFSYICVGTEIEYGIQYNIEILAST